MMYRGVCVGDDGLWMREGREGEGVAANKGVEGSGARQEGVGGLRAESDAQGALLRLGGR